MKPVIRAPSSVSESRSSDRLMLSATAATTQRSRQLNRLISVRTASPARARRTGSRGGRAGPGPSLTATRSTHQPPSAVRRRVPLYHFALMTPRTLRDQAELFRRLHQGPAILVLPNAWD